MLSCPASWRLPLGESGLLEHVLSVVPVTEEPQHALNKQALRLVGNACADCGTLHFSRMGFNLKANKTQTKTGLGWSSLVLSPGSSWLS